MFYCLKQVAHEFRDLRHFSSITQKLTPATSTTGHFLSQINLKLILQDCSSEICLWKLEKSDEFFTTCICFLNDLFSFQRWTWTRRQCKFKLFSTYEVIKIENHLSKITRKNYCNISRGHSKEFDALANLPGDHSWSFDEVDYRYETTVKL